MPAISIHVVTTPSGAFRSYRLRDEGEMLRFSERRWGEPAPRDWIVPELVATEASAGRPDADFTSFAGARVLIATEAAARVLEFPKLEQVPVKLGTEVRVLLNPLLVVRRYRPQQADVVRAPGGSMLLMNRADFHAADVPADPACFWYHDGRSARFLLCNEGFRGRVFGAGLSGLAFRPIGRAY